MSPSPYKLSITNARLIDLIRENFKRRLSQKTGWGRVELMLEFEIAVTDALAQCLDEVEKGETGDG